MADTYTGSVGPLSSILIYGYDEENDEFKALVWASLEETIDSLTGTLSVISIFYAYDGSSLRRLTYSQPGETLSFSYGLPVTSIPFVWDGSAYRRLEQLNITETLSPNYGQVVAAIPYFWDGSAYRRIEQASIGETISANYGQIVASLLYGYDADNTTYRRLLVDQYGRLIVVQLPRKDRGSNTGNTTDSETVASTIDVREYNKVTIIVKNTGTSNNMDVRVRTYTDYSAGTIYHVDEEWTIPPGETRKTVIEGVDKAEVTVQSSVSGNATSYTIEWMTWL